MSAALKRALLGAALLATLLAAWYAPAPDGAVVESSAPARAPGPAQGARVRGASAPLVDVLAIRARDGDDDDDDDAGLFVGAARPAEAATAPPPAPAPLAEPAAQLPPLPFRVLGTHEQAGKTVVFLQQNEFNHVVRVGDTIGDTYKVESLEGSTLTLRYLPMNQTQTLDLGRTLKEEK
ncbi:hypothetical protein [Massilia sp. CCM 8734]|uniref:hypothetical protein n=1 Tax=Massilia sp. CCM 8734 TaxID=2609283 RepID=UPI00141FC6D5|nr:hypothetical protein [Massilia sp. CCM 8734]NHZ99840.1 hypothetical protein [Massilia sp. CCM 8734]